MAGPVGDASCAASPGLPGVGKAGRSLAGDWKALPREQKALLGFFIALYAGASIGYLGAWAVHKPILHPVGVSLLMLALSGVIVWHSVIVRGWRQTVIFLAVTMSLSWFFEFIGHNYAWWFGHYKYTNTLRPAIGGVPVIIVITWPLVIYSAFMLIDWVLDIRGRQPASSIFGRIAWAALIAASATTLVTAWNIMLDPFANSRVWMLAAKVKPWYFYQTGGPFLRELPVMPRAGEFTGKPGIAIGAFVGWWLVGFFVIFIFCLLFQKPHRVSGSLVNVVPLLVYIFLFAAIFISLLMMNWFFNGMNQVALIGFFTMMPVITVSLVKLVKLYTPGWSEMGVEQ